MQKNSNWSENCIPDLTLSDAQMILQGQISETGFIWKREQSVHFYLFALTNTKLRTPLHWTNSERRLVHWFRAGGGRQGGEESGV